MFNHIKNYLDECAGKDPAFAEKYNPEKVNECLEFIQSQLMDTYIKKNGKKNGACGITPEALFKMARDFFIDGSANVDENSIVTFVKETPKTEVKEETEEERTERLKKEEEERKQKEIEKIKREQEERERKQYEKEHKDGQTSIFDLLGG